jgi:hypothetical protein
VSAQPGTSHHRSATEGATRYLCAAPYLDGRFAAWVVDEILENELRASAPSYGVDVLPVVRHCVRARRLKIARDAVITAIVVGGSALLYLLGYTLTELLLRVVSLAWATVFASLCLTHYEIITARMVRNRFDPHAAPSVSPRRERLLRSLADETRSNVTVYSGFSPFVGSGIDLSGWSFVVDTRRGKEDLDGSRLQPVPFEVDDLYRRVASHMGDLRLDRLTMEGRLFVNGRELDGLPWLLPEVSSRPRVLVDPQIVDQFRKAPSDQVRHYSTLQIVGWQGELVVTIFLRFSFTGDNLFCEVSRFLLTPVAERYHQVDDLNVVPDLRAVARLLGRSVMSTVFLAPFSTFLLLGHALAPWRRWRRRRIARRLARQCPTYDHGATTTVRQQAMSTNYAHYFQKLDRQMYVKLVEQQILDAVVTFLDSHNIDTSELKERQTTILNNGVMVSGGTIQAQSFAVGSGARARTEQAVRSMVRK